MANIAQGLPKDWVIPFTSKLTWLAKLIKAGFLTVCTCTSPEDELHDYLTNCLGTLLKLIVMQVTNFACLFMLYSMSNLLASSFRGDTN